MSTGTRKQKEKSGFTHHKESLWHRTPFYKGSESAPPFGLIHEREREREGCHVATLLRAAPEETGDSTTWRHEDPLMKQTHCSVQIGRVDQPWWEEVTGRLASPERYQELSPHVLQGGINPSGQNQGIRLKWEKSVCVCMKF